MRWPATPVSAIACGHVELFDLVAGDDDETGDWRFDHLRQSTSAPELMLIAVAARATAPPMAPPAP